MRTVPGGTRLDGTDSGRSSRFVAILRRAQHSIAGGRVASRRQAFALAAIVAAAFALRAVGLDWGLPDRIAPGDAPFHPDEFAVYSRGRTLYTSPDHVTFSWGGALYFRLAFAARIVADQLGGVLDDSRFAAALLLLRASNVALAAATVAIVGRLGLRSYGPAVGLAAAAFLACFPNHVLESHYARPDVLLAFLCAAVLAVACDLATRGGTARAAAGGALAGLALATSLWGLVAVAPLGAAAVVRARADEPSSRAARAREAAALCASVGAGCAAGYALGSFETFLFWDAFLDGVGWAASSYDAGFAWPTAHVSIVAWYAFGTLATLCAYGGLVLMVARRRPVDWVLLAFTVAGCALLGRMRGHMIRYVLFLAPVVALAAALAVSELARRIRIPRTTFEARTAVLAALVLAPSLASSLAYVRAMAFDVDPRVRAGRWLVENAPPGSTVGVTQSFPGDHTYAPRLPEGHHLSIDWMLLTGRDDAARHLARPPDYVVTTDYATGRPRGLAFARALVAAGYELRRVEASTPPPLELARHLGRQPPGDLLYVQATYYVYEHANGAARPATPAERKRREASSAPSGDARRPIVP